MQMIQARFGTPLSDKQTLPVLPTIRDIKIEPSQREPSANMSCLTL